MNATSDWRHHAACRNEELPDNFFPTSDAGPGWQAVIADAKAVCRRCPVADQCLQWALDNPQETGIWGGLTEAERRNLRRSTVRPSRARKAA